MKKVMVLASLVLASCSTSVPPQPANPKVVSDIVSACTIDGVFKNVGGRLVLQSLPYVGAADSIIAVGIDRVCSDPQRYAGDLATASWVLRNLRAILRRSSGSPPA